MWTRTHLLQFIGGLIVYGIVLVATLSAFDHGLVPTAAKAPVALLPMVPLVFVALAVTATIRESDELQRRIQYEALSFAFAFTAMVTFSYGFLEVYAGFPHLSMFVVWPVMAALWILGRLLAQRRYA